MKQEEKDKLYMEAMEELEEEDKEESFDDNQELMHEWQDAYGAPEAEEKQNAHSFLHKAAFSSGDTVRTTFLHEAELGRPLFSVRFLSDMQDIASHYLDKLLSEYGLKPKEFNLVAKYFWNKRENITESGMSNKGFAMNLNVTRKMDSMRQRTKPNLENLKGGNQK